MKYPLDQTSYSETLNEIAHHEQSQSALIKTMADLLEDAMDASSSAEDDWYKDAETLLTDMHALKMWHESRRFNEDVMRSQMPEDSAPTPLRIKSKVERPPEEYGMPDEEELGELTEEDLQRHFKEKRKTKAHKEATKSLKEMTLDEIESWERAQENATDIYKIKARVANIARGGSMNLTPVGEILCNTYVHVLKAFYDFADKLEDKSVKVQLTELIRSQEGLPGTIIAAAGAGVVEKTTERPRRKLE